MLQNQENKANNIKLNSAVIPKMITILIISDEIITRRKLFIAMAAKLAKNEVLFFIP
jgi:hypothetical protein